MNQIRQCIPTKVNKQTNHSLTIVSFRNFFSSFNNNLFRNWGREIVVDGEWINQWMEWKKKKKKKRVSNQQMAYHVWEMVLFGSFLWWTVTFDAKRLVTLHLHLNLWWMNVYRYVLGRCAQICWWCWNSSPPLSPFATAAISNIILSHRKMGMCMRVIPLQCVRFLSQFQFTHFICLLFTFVAFFLLVAFCFSVNIVYFHHWMYNDIFFLWDDFHFKSLHDIIRFNWFESFLMNLDEHLTLMTEKKKKKTNEQLLKNK